MSLTFERVFEPRYGEAVTLAPGIQRVTANNPSPFTYKGTNTFLVGEKSLAIIDPGPDDEDHLEALKRAIDGRPVSHILLTHTHMDHSPLAAALKAETGAPTYAEGRHRAAREISSDETNTLDDSSDYDFTPDRRLVDGARLDGEGWTLQAVTTPGHTANHMAFAMPDRSILFSGDHVMGWSTTIVAPPDGSMNDYMASLEKLLARDERVYLPAHGGVVEEPHGYLRGLISHRRMREKAILDRLAAGDQTIDEMVRAIYRGVDEDLHNAASLTLLAQLEDLVARGKVATVGHPQMESRFQLLG